ncbi:DUF4426 domain-containing protein [Parahaliea mediterranea]|uniref:DUF4426 domain-containing protein n=1 Tax=Parahaliea mediterranea TaxID=651086 RepID=A0A939DG59_9GAMM|nr:DUF4426 domain-containing protein [Parahaliea mediterranea]MBN7797276.1 DUF4426 domain-containing protein [Parahaliea mediterranea]
MKLRQLYCLFTLLLACAPALAQQSERFGPYELHYSVVNTTFLEPEVAARYGIVRGEKRAIVNLAVREHLAEGGAATRPMQLKGRTWDLMQNQDLDFQEVREGPAVYYIAPFRFINREWRFFEVDFRPEGADTTYTFKFKHQLFIH